MNARISGKLGIDTLLVFVFGTIFVIALLVIGIAIPNPTSSQEATFRIVLALAAAGVAAVMPGLLNINVATGKRFRLRAAGALAVFVLVYLVNPAQIVIK
jgi:hypothetical protein